MRYDPAIVSQVQNANDIVEVIGQYIPLKKSGKNYKGLSPFRQEKTPSFFVNPEKQLFYCFSTGVGGDVFNFLMRYENLSFPEALRQLAERVSIQLPEPSRRDQERYTDTEKVYQAYQLAADFYHACFSHAEYGKEAKAYLTKRGYGDEFFKTFHVGWSSDAWQNLYNYLRKKRFFRRSSLEVWID